jgi:hypothetical protein
VTIEPERAAPVAMAEDESFCVVDLVLHFWCSEPSFEGACDLLKSVSDAHSFERKFWGEREVIGFRLKGTALDRIDSLVPYLLDDSDPEVGAITQGGLASASYNFHILFLADEANTDDIDAVLAFSRLVASANGPTVLIDDATDTILFEHGGG